jgi:hydroxymethylpyrimidine pyrophosphatase-like HAD family hydrolase
MTPLRCVYSDLDGTMLGRGASLLRDAEGNFSLLPVRALEACHRAGVEVVIYSGRRKAQVYEDARLIGQPAYIYEMGCALVDRDEEVFLTGELEPRPGASVYEQIDELGAPRLLLETYAGRLEYHAPWHTDRHFSHLFRGEIEVAEAHALLERHGMGQVRVVDNGLSWRHYESLAVAKTHVYHLIPRVAGKGRAVAVHMRRRSLAPDECIAVGDALGDLEVADAVGRFFLVANAVENDPAVRANRHANVTVTEEAMSNGFYEAVVRALAER